MGSRQPSAESRMMQRARGAAPGARALHPYRGTGVGL